MTNEFFKNSVIGAFIALETFGRMSDSSLENISSREKNNCKSGGSYPSTSLVVLVRLGKGPPIDGEGPTTVFCAVDVALLGVVGCGLTLASLFAGGLCGWALEYLGGGFGNLDTSIFDDSPIKARGWYRKSLSIKSEKYPSSYRETSKQLRRMTLSRNLSKTLDLVSFTSVVKSK